MPRPAAEAPAAAQPALPAQPLPPAAAQPAPFAATQPAPALPPALAPIAPRPLRPGRTAPDLVAAAPAAPPAAAPRLPGQAQPTQSTARGERPGRSILREDDSPQPGRTAEPGLPPHDRAAPARAGEGPAPDGPRPLTPGQPEALPLAPPPPHPAAPDAPTRFAPDAGPQPAQASAPPAPGAAPAHADMPRHLPADILRAATRAEKEERVELLLDPVELGRLRFEIQPGADRLEVVVAVERPETLDLLRRNLDLLRAEFREAGFGSANLSFGQWGQGGDAPPSPLPAFADAAPGLAGDLSLPPLPAPRPAAASGGLDLRL